MRKASVRRALRPLLTPASLASGQLSGGPTGSITFDALGERGAMSLSYAIVSSLTLYLDFTNLFLFLLRFTGNRWE